MYTYWNFLKHSEDLNSVPLTECCWSFNICLFLQKCCSWVLPYSGGQHKGHHERNLAKGSETKKRIPENFRWDIKSYPGDISLTLSENCFLHACIFDGCLDCFRYHCRRVWLGGPAKKWFLSCPGPKDRIGSVAYVRRLYSYWLWKLHH